MHTLIIEERARRAMTQKRLAHEAGIDPRTLRKIEKGEQVSADSMYAVYKVLGINPREQKTTKTEASEDRRRPTALRMLALAAILCLPVWGVLFAFEYTRSNGAITITHPSPCHERSADVTVERIRAILPEVSFDRTFVNTGTDSCEVEMIVSTRKAGPTRDDVIRRLKDGGVTAKVRLSPRKIDYL